MAPGGFGSPGSARDSVASLWPRCCSPRTALTIAVRIDRMAKDITAAAPRAGAPPAGQGARVVANGRNRGAALGSIAPLASTR